MAFNQTSIRHFIKEHGFTVTFKQRTRGTYDVASGTSTTVDTDYTVDAFFTNRSPAILRDDGIVISSRDVVISRWDTSGVEIPLPLVNDQVIIFGRAYDIVRVNDTKSSNNIIIYVLSLKD
jgi:hypothetical protein